MIILRERSRSRKWLRPCSVVPHDHRRTDRGGLPPTHAALLPCLRRARATRASRRINARQRILLGRRLCLQRLLHEVRGRRARQAQRMGRRGSPRHPAALLTPSRRRRLRSPSVQSLDPYAGQDSFTNVGPPAPPLDHDCDRDGDGDGIVHRGSVDLPRAACGARGR